ncbi:MAG: enoyl-CoA hydratase-related protein [Haliea sp.]
MDSSMNITKEINFHPQDHGRAELNLENRKEGVVATIILSHKDKMNAMGSHMMMDIQNIFQNLESMDDLRVVVIRGKGSRAFVGGAFVPEMATLTVNASIAYITRLHETILYIRNCSVPVIAQIEGYCLGAGTELAAACDLRIAAQNAKFGMPEVTVGMPSIIDASLLPPLIGWGKTREMLYTGALYNAEESSHMGLVETVAEPDQIDATTEMRISQILAAGPLAIRAQKKLLREWESQSPDEAALSSIRFMGAAFENGEPQRMMTRFLKS